jgi:hypothetical protein
MGIVGELVQPNSRIPIDHFHYHATRKPDVLLKTVNTYCPNGVRLIHDCLAYAR